ncbi:MULTISPECIES: H-NS family nucleoid-associated regulatory protein [Roseobacteraceae]|uniref:H-NS histone family protein n=1 Tax=Roseobacteraceae TaxID=2854170 RepID=UPI000B7A5334|nr:MULTISPECIES: H-NS histone family protein [Roseobacteraceae]
MQASAIRSYFSGPPTHTLNGSLIRHRYSLAEVVGTDSKPKRTPVAPKYQHPENSAVIWSGRGRKPQWFVDSLNAGKDLSGLTMTSVSRTFFAFPS